MAKRNRGKRQSGREKRGEPPTAHAIAWLENDGIHVVSSGPLPSEAALGQMTRRCQERLRRSPLWAQMVKEYGEEKADQLLRQCRVELR
jgi:hypothetical protein